MQHQGNNLQAMSGASNLRHKPLAAAHAAMLFSSLNATGMHVFRVTSSLWSFLSGISMAAYCV